MKCRMYGLVNNSQFNLCQKYIYTFNNQCYSQKKANSDPCILESVLFVQQLYTFWIEMLKKLPSEYRFLFSTPFTVKGN